MIPLRILVASLMFGALMLGGLASCKRSPHSQALALVYIRKIYVLIEPSSIESLSASGRPDELDRKNETQHDFVPRFFHTTVTIDEAKEVALTAYTDEELVPKGRMFMAMRVRQLFEIALAERDGAGVALTVNPNSRAKTYLISRSDMIEAIPHLPRHEPMPLEVGLKR